MAGTKDPRAPVYSQWAPMPTCSQKLAPCREDWPFSLLLDCREHSYWCTKAQRDAAFTRGLLTMLPWGLSCCCGWWSIWINAMKYIHLQVPELCHEGTTVILPLYFPACLRTFISQLKFMNWLFSHSLSMNLDVTSSLNASIFFFLPVLVCVF